MRCHGTPRATQPSLSQCQTDPRTREPSMLFAVNLTATRSDCTPLLVTSLTTSKKGSLRSGSARIHTHFQSSLGHIQRGCRFSGCRLTMHSSMEYSIRIILARLFTAYPLYRIEV